MKRAAHLLLISALVSGLVVGIDNSAAAGKSVSSKQTAKVTVVFLKGSDAAEKKGSFDITEKKGSFDITEKAAAVKPSVLVKKGSFDTDGKDPEFPVTPN